MHGILEFLYRLVVTCIVLIPSITAIVVAFTIIYDKDFRKNKVPKQKENTSPKEDSKNSHGP